MDINTFYNSTLSEIFFVCEGYRNRQKADYNLQFYAFFNAYGMLKGGKKFKPINIFDDEPKQAYKKVDDDTRDREVGYLQSLIEAQQGKG